jgi:hypothetical protein
MDLFLGMDFLLNAILSSRRGSWGMATRSCVICPPLFLNFQSKKIDRTAEPISCIFTV